MIENQEQLSQAIEQMNRMYRALANLKSEVFPLSSRQFALMAEGPSEEIQALQRDIDLYLGRETIEENSADLWLHICGKEIQWPDTPISVLTAFLNSLRKGLQTTATFIATGRLSTRPTSELKQFCDLRVVSLQTGSLRIGTKLPDEVETNSFNKEKELAHQALSEYLKVATWLDSEQELENLESSILEPQKRRLLLNALKQITPRLRGEIDKVEIYGRLIGSGKKISLTRQTHKRIDQAIDHIVAETVETHLGDLREIDLDNYSFILRNSGDIQEIRCSFEEDLLENAKVALGRRVQVTGVRRVDDNRRSYAILKITRLEFVDEQDS